MPEPDLNLLFALDALLSEKNVTRAARSLHLSASAMSRTLTRLRAVTGDPLLVRAGRQMVLTPYAEEIRERTENMVREARALLRPSPVAPDFSTLRRTLAIRANEAFVEAFGPPLIAEVTAIAPLVRLHFSSRLACWRKPGLKYAFRHCFATATWGWSERGIRSKRNDT
jgi:DNA-binding transcriptional LysR family regulator